MFGGIPRMFRKVRAGVLMLGFFVGLGLVMHACFPSIAYAQDDFKYSPGVVMFFASMWASGVNWLGDALGSLTLMVIEVVVINVLNYNNFSSSTIVTLGWTLTRDIVNMFAVIVLLVMAVKAMIGQGGSAWQQHIPRFFLGIVAANFSRTLCGLAIDASQVVMMTFVNALLSIAAGNFAQLFVLPQATKFSADTFQNAAELGVAGLVTAASMVANAYAKLMVQAVVLAVLLLLAIAFIWRIVVLWIALIMAPIAGFAWGSKEVVGFLGRFYSEWVAAFVPPLVLGPMLTFFLYLALAASSNGHLAKVEAFPEPETRTTYGQVTLEVFESSNFAGLLLAVVFLVIGIKESAKVAAKMGGLASMAINEKTTGRVFRAGGWVTGKTVGAAAKLTTRATLKAAGGAGLIAEMGANKLGTRYGATGAVGRTLRGVGKMGALTAAATNAIDDQVRLLPTDVTKMPGYAKNRGAQIAKGASGLATDVGRSLSQGIARNVSSPALASALNALGPNALLAAGSALHTQEHHISEAEAKAAKERVSRMTDAEKALRLQQALDGTGEKSIEATADAAYLRGMLFTDKNFEKNFEAATGTRFESLVEGMLTDFQHDADAGHLSIDKETWNKARSRYLDIYAKASPSKVAGFIDSEDFSGRLMRAKAGANAAVIAALAASSAGKTENGRVITKLDELNRGNYGAGKAAEALRYMARADFTPPSGASVAAIAAAEDRVKSVIEAKINIDNLAAEEIQTEADAAMAAGRAPAFTATDVKREFAEQVMATQGVENITRAFSSKQIDESLLTGSMFDASNPNVDSAIQAMARTEGIDLSRISAIARDRIALQLAQMEDAGNRISQDDASELRKRLISAGKTIPDVFIDSATGRTRVDPNPTSNPHLTISGNERLRMQQLFKADPSAIRHIDSAISAGKNDFTAAVVENLSREDFQKLAEAIRKETDTAKKTAIREAMASIDRALAAYEADFRRDLAALQARRTAAVVSAASPTPAIATAGKQEIRDVERDIAQIEKSDEYQRVRRARNDYMGADRYMT